MSTKIYAEIPEPDFGPGRYLGKALNDDAYTKAQMRDFADRTHAARLRCKSEQARLATLWGYVRADATPALNTAPEGWKLVCWANINKQGDVTHTQNKQGAWARTALYAPTPQQSSHRSQRQRKWSPTN